MTNTKERILYFFELIIADITEKGLSLNKAAKGRMSRTTFYELIESDEKKLNKYTRAIKSRSDLDFERLTEIAEKRDEDHTPFTGSNVIQRDKLICDVIKFKISKEQPKKYGDKIDITTDGDKITTSSDTIELLNKLNEKLSSSKSN